ncbi:MCF.2 cell line derived transforming sequence [Phyllostomus discolor]|uniref:MCF.2 cell line derived transforming sequence n=1 Tax=Phyllostomus discolor TaxID=89673 RepID=A0A833ZEC1_9CHIR|nr:MCF.2 cell line derived transforming sequence [Phyllostomus discolor]
MAADGSRPHLGSPTLEARHVPQASAPQTPLLGGRSRDLPPDQDGCVSLPTAQIIPLQVDMAMAQERGKRVEKCTNSYLCLLPTVFVADSGVHLRVKDISHFLMQDIAFLSGGRGKDDAWIVTFPENCNFKCISEEVIEKVLTYLTYVARQNGSDSRFTIILDRRLDTWSSVKISLQKISVKDKDEGISEYHLHKDSYHSTLKIKLRRGESQSHQTPRRVGAFFLPLSSLLGHA